MMATHTRNLSNRSCDARRDALTARRTPNGTWFEVFLRFRSHAGLRGVGGLLLILVLLGLAPTNARADCSFNNGYTTSPVSFSPSGTILVPFDFVPNAVLYTSSAVAPSNPPNVSCGANTGYGVANPSGAPTGSGANIVYPTVVSGLGYILVHADAPSSSMVPYAQGSNGNAATNSTFSVATTLKLVQTGPIANGSVLPAGQLASWQWGSLTPEIFVLSNPVTFTSPGCTVITSDIYVFLPTVPISALPNKNSTAGDTPFNIQLSCPSGSASTKLYIEFDALGGTVTSGGNTVLKNTGSAAKIGVQLLGSDGTTPVDFGSATQVKNSIPSGLLSLPYFARYYRTGGGAIGSIVGTVNASATFTLTYQ